MVFNWVDIIVLLTLVVATIHGWRMGAVALLSSFASLLLALWLSIRLSPYIGMFMSDKFGIPRFWGDIAGYVLLAVIVQLFLSALFSHYIQKIPKGIVHSRQMLLLGAGLGLLNGLMILAFFLLIFLILPIRGTVREDIQNSLFGSRIVNATRHYGGEFTESIDTMTESTVKFLTITPGSRSRQNLPLVPTEITLKTDTVAELEMLQLINIERQNVNVPPLEMDPKLREIARQHSREMFQKNYFSHLDLLGSDGEVRLRESGITFNSAGENLAHTADIALAHEELMASPNHRQNILDAQFTRVGIGIVDAGMYGKMVTQDFTD